MKELNSVGLCYQNNQLLVLNQQRLPHAEDWIVCKSPASMCDIIRSLQVRGAPLIGIAAALALADYAERGATIDEIRQAAKELKATRPTAVNLAYCIDKQLQHLIKTNDTISIVSIAEELFIEDMQLCEQIAMHGGSLLQSGDAVLTHCNTGGLVTTGIGTALGIIHQFYLQNKDIHVFVDETRPLLQGGRLTTWELQRANIPYTLICDNMAASLMRQGKITKIIVGADRIARNGDFANKIGTYNLAVLANYHHVPFYVAAPYTTFDQNCASSHDIIIEERAADEVRGVKGDFGNVIWSIPNSHVYNPAFDVTPAELVTAFILNTGIVKPEALQCMSEIKQEKQEMLLQCVGSQ